MSSSGSRKQRREEGYSRLIRAAQERYVRGERIEIAAIAAANDISRATAYRWLGDNDQLLCEVLLDRTRKNFEQRRLEFADKRGKDRVLSIVHGFLEHAARSENLSTLLRNEPQRALRILASGAFPIQRMVVGMVQALLVEVDAAGELELTVDAHTLAYAMVRLVEAFLYADVVAGEQVNIEQAYVMLELLLTTPASAPRRESVEDMRRGVGGSRLRSSSR